MASVKSNLLSTDVENVANTEPVNVLKLALSISNPSSLASTEALNVVFKYDAVDCNNPTEVETDAVYDSKEFNLLFADAVNISKAVVSATKSVNLIFTDVENGIYKDDVASTTSNLASTDVENVVNTEALSMFVLKDEIKTSCAACEVANAPLTPFNADAADAETNSTLSNLLSTDAE